MGGMRRIRRYGSASWPTIVSRISWWAPATTINQWGCWYDEMNGLDEENESGHEPHGSLCDNHLGWAKEQVTRSIIKQRSGNGEVRFWSKLHQNGTLSWEGGTGPLTRTSGGIVRECSFGRSATTKSKSIGQWWPRPCSVLTFSWQMLFRLKPSRFRRAREAFCLEGTSGFPAWRSWGGRNQILHERGFRRGMARDVYTMCI